MCDVTAAIWTGSERWRYRIGSAGDCRSRSASGGDSFNDNRRRSCDQLRDANPLRYPPSRRRRALLSGTV